MPTPTAADAEKTTGRSGLFWLIALLTGVLLLLALLYLLFPLSMLPGNRLRYLLFPPLIIVLFFAAGARYVQHFYSLIDPASGFNYLTARLFGQNLPVLMVSDGKIQVKVMGRENLLYSVGGPGYLFVRPGNAAAIESVDGEAHVAGAGGSNYISSRESVKEALSLEERFDDIGKVTAVTRDGIEITAREVRYRFRVYAGPDSAGFGRTPENPYPYSDEGVINLVYGRAMRPEGLPDWHAVVKEVVEDVLQDFIRTNMVDHLTAPQPGSEDPRHEIDRLYHSDAVRRRLRAIGAELLWIDIGHLEMPEKVAGQHVDLWQVRWSGNVRLMRAHSEAERVKYAELARAEAQANFLSNIIKTLEAADSRGAPHVDRQTLYLTGITEMLELLEKGEDKK